MKIIIYLDDEKTFACDESHGRGRTCNEPWMAKQFESVKEAQSYREEFFPRTYYTLFSIIEE